MCHAVVTLLVLPYETVVTGKLKFPSQNVNKDRFYGYV